MGGGPDRSVLKKLVRTGHFVKVSSFLRFREWFGSLRCGTPEYTDLLVDAGTYDLPKEI